MPARRPVGLVRIDVVEVEKERLGKGIQELEGTRIDTVRRPLETALVEDVEAGLEASLPIDRRRGGTDDEARRHGSGGVAAVAQAGREIGGVGWHGHAVGVETIQEVLWPARREQRVDRRKSAAGVGPAGSEDDAAVAREAIERRTRPALIAVEREPVGAERVDQDDDEIPGPLRDGMSRRGSARAARGAEDGGDGQQGGAGSRRAVHDHRPIVRPAAPSVNARSARTSCGGSPDSGRLRSPSRARCSHSSTG